MSKFLPALLAAGFVFGAGATLAQNVKSDGVKTMKEDQIMEQKEQGQSQSQKGQREQPTADEGRSTQGSSSQNSSSQGNSGQNSSSQGSSDTGSAANDQGSSSGQGSNQNSQSGQSQTKQAPPQAQDSIGHPNEARPTGQGEDVRKENQVKGGGQSDTSTGTASGSQDNTSGQSGSDQSQGQKKRRMQQ
jgi:hypothetical protein